MSEEFLRSISSLEEISIRNLGVIESANIEFSPGLTVLTGETGAGKTLVLTALGMVLGAKSDADLVRTGSERSVVSAKFGVNSIISERALDLGGDIDSDELLLTRTITSEGKSRISIGGALSTAAKVSDLAELLIEIHGQSTNLKLAKASVQRELLDQFVGAEGELLEYQRIFDEHRQISDRIAALREQSAKKEGEIAALKSFVEDFSKIMPIRGEIERIEDEINRLGNVEELNGTITNALNLIEGEDGGVNSALQNARKALETLRGKDSTLDRQIEKFSALVFDFADTTSDLVLYLSALEADPARFDALQQRKSAINSLLKKHGTGSDRLQAFELLIDRFERAHEKIADLNGGDERILELENNREKVLAHLRKAAMALSSKRSLGAKNLSVSVTMELKKLSMPNAELICQVIANEGLTIKDFDAFGLDEVQLLFAGHKGAQPLPLSKVASGGETSRVMLALSVVIADSSPIGTYIFDEVDAGVGGAAAIEVGRRLKALAKQSQVIVVTHLAQVAVWADNHLVVQKDQSGLVSATDVRSLDEGERKVEIARMLSGQSHSTTAQEHAAELLQLVRNS